MLRKLTDGAAVEKSATETPAMPITHRCGNEVFIFSA